MPIRRHPRTDLLKIAKEKLIGQDKALEAVNRCIEIYQAGLAPQERPAGIYLLLGPTGTGKTHTVEVLAEALHGSPRNVLRVDCAEFQMEHEVAKLIGAPPGYLGHRETHALLNQTRINAVASERSELSILLFDEIEKAAPSLTRLLLGILDRATLRLGDNTVVNFDRCLIFMTSNLGARQMMRETEGAFGLTPKPEAGSADTARRLEAQAMRAMKKHFSPEFVNRIDGVFTYQPLTATMFGQILDLQLMALRDRIFVNLGDRAFRLLLTPRCRQFLIEKGTSTEYGARELKRAVQRHVLEPLAAAFARGEITPGAVATLHRSGDGTRVEVGPAPYPFRRAA